MVMYGYPGAAAPVPEETKKPKKKKRSASKRNKDGKRVII